MTNWFKLYGLGKMLNFKILNYLLKQWRTVRKQMRKGVQCLTQ